MPETVNAAPLRRDIEWGGPDEGCPEYTYATRHRGGEAQLIHLRDADFAFGQVKLGGGAQATCYLGVKSNGEACAIKAVAIAPPRAGGAKRSFSDVRHEIELTARVHPEDVPAFFVGWDTGAQAWAAFAQAARSGDLASLCGGMPISRAAMIDFLRQIAYEVLRCHEQRVLHNDIKCENILYDEDGSLSLCDFGNAVDLNESPPTVVAPTMAAVAAPELLLDGVQTDDADVTKADSWAVGVACVNLLGFDPFERAVRAVGREPGGGKIDAYRRVMTPVFDDFEATRAVPAKQLPGPDVPPKLHGNVWISMWQEVDKLGSEIGDIIRGLLSNNPSTRLSVRDVLDRLPNVEASGAIPWRDATLQGAEARRHELALLRNTLRMLQRNAPHMARERALQPQHDSASRPVDPEVVPKTNELSPDDAPVADDAPGAGDTPRAVRYPQRPLWPLVLTGTFAGLGLAYTGALTALVWSPPHLFPMCLAAASCGGVLVSLIVALALSWRLRGTLLI